MRLENDLARILTAAGTAISRGATYWLRVFFGALRAEGQVLASNRGTPQPDDLLQRRLRRANADTRCDTQWEQVLRLPAVSGVCHERGRSAFVSVIARSQGEYGRRPQLSPVYRHKFSAARGHVQFRWPGRDGWATADRATDTPFQPPPSVTGWICGCTMHMPISRCPPDERARR